MHTTCIHAVVLNVEQLTMVIRIWALYIYMPYLVGEMEGEKKGFYEKYICFFREDK